MIRHLLTASLFALATLAVPAHAADDAGPGKDRQAMCKDNPERCEKMKERMKERCDADPKKCEEMKGRAADMKAKCDADPKACEEKKAQMRDRMKERMQDRRQ